MTASGQQHGLNREIKSNHVYFRSVVFCWFRPDQSSEPAKLNGAHLVVCRTLAFHNEYLALRYMYLTHIALGDLISTVTFAIRLMDI